MVHQLKTAVAYYHLSTSLHQLFVIRRGSFKYFSWICSLLMLEINSFVWWKDCQKSIALVFTYVRGARSRGADFRFCLQAKIFFTFDFVVEKAVLAILILMQKTCFIAETRNNSKLVPTFENVSGDYFASVVWKTLTLFCLCSYWQNVTVDHNKQHPLCWRSVFTKRLPFCQL